MARKSSASVPSIAMQEFVAVAEAKYELAADVYQAQDEPTRATIKRVADAIKLQATGEARIAGRLLPVEGGTIDHLVFWMAVEIVKDLAFSDIRIANFVFPANLCSECGATVGRKRG